MDSITTLIVEDEPMLAEILVDTIKYFSPVFNRRHRRQTGKCEEANTPLSTTVNSIG